MSREMALAIYLATFPASALAWLLSKFGWNGWAP